MAKPEQEKMKLEDILNNPEAEEELKGKTKDRPKVSQEQHEAYVQQRLLEVFQEWQKSTANSPSPLETKYQRAYAEIGRFPTILGYEDISRFCARKEHSRTDPNTRRDLGLFVSGLINNPLEGSTLDLRYAPLLDFFGYRFNGNLNVKGNLGDNTAYKMQGGLLDIDGNCEGVVGPFMEAGTLLISGTVRDIAAIKYGGTIQVWRNLGNYYHFTDIHDLQRVLNGEQPPLLQGISQEIRQGVPITLHPGIKSMLHPKLVEIACDNNIRIYERERSNHRTSLDSVERGYNELVEQWNKLVKAQNIGKEATAAGVGGVITGLIATPMFVLGGGYALYGIVKALSAGGQLQKMELKLEALKSTMNYYRNQVGFYDSKISEVRSFLHH